MPEFIVATVEIIPIVRIPGTQKPNPFGITVQEGESIISVETIEDMAGAARYRVWMMKRVPEVTNE